MSTNSMNVTSSKESKIRMKKTGPEANLRTSSTVNAKLLNAYPRSGHLLKSSVKSTSGQLESDTLMTVYFSPSREHRIKEALNITKWGSLGSDTTIDGTGALAGSMLAVTISCVMLMAADASQIPDEYLEYAQQYLSCIKDEHDRHPPNIEGILAHINCERIKKEKQDKETCKVVSDFSVKQPDSKNDLKKKSSSKEKIKKPQTSRTGVNKQTKPKQRYPFYY